MSRVARRDVPNRANDCDNTPSRQCRAQSVKSNGKLVDPAKNVFPGNVLKEAVVEIEDMGKFLHCSSNRIIFSDKTNKSSIGKFSSVDTRTGKTRPLKSTRKIRLSNMSDNKIENTSPSSDQKSIDDKLKYHKKLQQSENVENSKLKYHKKLQQSENVENSVTNTSSVSHTCVYTKIQRETMKNKNMPIEEKLAQYDFEVDENEPIVKKKKKKNVKGRKKINKSPEEYLPRLKVSIKEVRQLHHRKVVQEVETIPKNILIEQNIKSVPSRKISVYDKAASNGNTPVAEYSSPIPLVNKRNTNDFLKNTPPISQPNGRKTLEMQEVKSIGMERSEMEISGDANDCLFDVSCSMNTPKRQYRSNRNMTRESPILGETKTIESSTVVDRSFNGNLISTISEKPRISCINAVGACGTPTKTQPCETRVSEHKVASTSFGSSLSNRTADMSNFSLHNSHGHSSIPLHQKVLFVPRVSGGLGGQNNETIEKWSVDNCFGFEDGNDEIETSLPNHFSKLKTLRSVPFSSTPLVSNGKKELVRDYFKRKLDSLDGRREKSIEISDSPDAKRRELLSNENLLSHTATVFSPSSNPLKQSKLDFTPSSSKTPVGENRGQNNGSPLLFKETEDNTPIHFKEPPRRSYVRSIRKKMKPLGDDWIEVDSDAEEERENKKDTKKGKKGKLSKQEEKEAKKWMKEFNSECGEIEDFQLCVE